MSQGYVRTDEEREGYEAARNRTDFGNCPYPTNSKEAENWRKGYEDYETDQADKYSSQKYGF